jgi:hypothetical protein
MTQRDLIRKKTILTLIERLSVIGMVGGLALVILGIGLSNMLLYGSGWSIGAGALGVRLIAFFTTKLSR